MNFAQLIREQKRAERISDQIGKNVAVFLTNVEKEFSPNAYYDWATSLYFNKAVYKKLNDGTWFGEIPGCNGVWANHINRTDCEKELKEVLDDWLALKPALKSRQQIVRHNLNHSAVTA